MPSPYARRSTSGIAVETTLSVGINDSVEAFTIVDSSGWPSGAGGSFYAQIDDEVIDCASQTAGAVTVVSGGRGASDTPAASHLAGATVKLVFTSNDADDANYAASETVGKVTTSQDLLVADGAHSLTRLGITNNRALIVTSSLVSWGQITSAMLATDSVGSAAIAADAVGSSEIAANAVGTSEIAANAVTEAKIATSVAGDGLAGGGGTALSVGVDGSSIEINADALRVKAGGITQAMHASGTFPTIAQTTAPTGSDGLLWYDTDDELLYVYNGSAWVCITPQAATVATNQSTSSASYTDLSTTGPAVTLTTGTKAVVHLRGWMANDTTADGALMSVAVSGATTVAAADANSIGNYIGNSQFLSNGGSIYLTGLTAGANTFTAKYRRDTGGTASFHDRTIVVTAIP